VRKALEAGATLEELHRVFAIVAFACGLPTYSSYGFPLMKYAEEYDKRKRKGAALGPTRRSATS